MSKISAAQSHSQLENNEVPVVPTRYASPSTTTTTTIAAGNQEGKDHNHQYNDASGDLICSTKKRFRNDDDTFHYRSVSSTDWHHRHASGRSNSYCAANEDPTHHPIRDYTISISHHRNADNYNTNDGRMEVRDGDYPGGALPGETLYSTTTDSGTANDSISSCTTSTIRESKHRYEKLVNNDIFRRGKNHGNGTYNSTISRCRTSPYDRNQEQGHPHNGDGEGNYSHRPYHDLDHDRIRRVYTEDDEYYIDPPSSHYYEPHGKDPFLNSSRQNYNHNNNIREEKHAAPCDEFPHHKRYKEQNNTKHEPLVLHGDQEPLVHTPVNNSKTQAIFRSSDSSALLDGNVKLNFRHNTDNINMNMNKAIDINNSDSSKNLAVGNCLINAISIADESYGNDQADHHRHTSNSDNRHQNHHRQVYTDLKRTTSSKSFDDSCYPCQSFHPSHHSHPPLHQSHRSQERDDIRVITPRHGRGQSRHSTDHQPKLASSSSHFLHGDLHPGRRSDSAQHQYHRHENRREYSLSISASSLSLDRQNSYCSSYRTHPSPMRERYHTVPPITHSPHDHHQRRVPSLLIQPVQSFASVASVSSAYDNYNTNNAHDHHQHHTTTSHHHHHPRDRLDDHECYYDDYSSGGYFAHDVNNRTTNPCNHSGAYRFVPEVTTEPACHSLSELNEHDVLCGRGGGTNTQPGNKRFRRLVRDHQAEYLVARRKAKPLIARRIVAMIRSRGGRYLKRNDGDGKYYEVGDKKAEGKTGQALREGLDVRNTMKLKEQLKRHRHHHHQLINSNHDVERNLSSSPKKYDKAWEREPAVVHQLLLSKNTMTDAEREKWIDFAPPKTTNQSKATSPDKKDTEQGSPQEQQEKKKERNGKEVEVIIFDHCNGNDDQDETPPSIEVIDVNI